MKMSRIESGMRITLAFYEAFNRHDIVAMAALISDDCIVESSFPAPDGRVYQGKEAVTLYWQQLFRETTDLHLDIEEIFGLGQRVVAQTRREWADAAANTHHLRGADILRIQSGSIRKIQAYIKG